MNKNVWLIGVAILSAGFIGCSKKQALSPEDTALLKGGNRGNFVTGGADTGENEELLSPVGATITGLNGDGLAPQDPFWGDNLANGERPFEPIFFGFDLNIILNFLDHSFHFFSWGKFIGQSNSIYQFN